MYEHISISEMQVYKHTNSKSVKYWQTMLTFLPKEEGPTMNRLKYGKKQNGNNRKKGRDGGERKGGVEAKQLKTFCKFCCGTHPHMQSVPCQ